MVTLTPVMGQPGDPGGDPDKKVPLGGTEILLAVGGLLGIGRLLKFRIGSRIKGLIR